MWELDVQLTADGIPVVIHDGNLKRTSNIRQWKEHAGRKPWPVSDFTLEELKCLDFGSWFIETDPFGQIAAGQIPAGDLDDFQNQKIPTLKEAMSFSRELGLAVNVEIKNLAGNKGHQEITGRTLEIIAQTDMTERTIVSSFNPDYIYQVSQLAPGTAAGLIVDHRPRDVIALLDSLGASAYHPRIDVINPDEIPLLLEHGLKVNVWTVNDRQSMKRLIGAGASGLITDFPQITARIP